MKKSSIGIYEGKAQFSALVAAAENGTETIVTRNGTAVAKIAPISERKASDAFGMDAGLVTIAADFDAPLADFEPYQ